MSNELKVKGIYADGMVLQRNTTNCIFGSAKSTSEVILTFRNEKVSAKADAEGQWKVEFNPGAEGGPFEITVASGSDSITFKDVYVGEVWVNSGQSNAQLPMERMMYSYPEDFALPANNGIRMITIPITFAFDGEKDAVQNPTWVCASPENLGGMSGTGYFFAKKLNQELGVPVGIINASQGGSPISAWMNKESLYNLPNEKTFIDLLEKYENPEAVKAKQKEDFDNHENWEKLIRSTDKGTLESWEKLSYDEVSDWDTVSIPNDIDNNNSACVIWMKKQIVLTAEQAKHFNEKKAWLWFGTILDSDTVYINGVQVGFTPYTYPPRRYAVPAGVLKEGKNTITARIQKDTKWGKIRFFKEKPYFLFTEGVVICPTAVRNVEAFTEVTPADGEKIAVDGEWKYKLGTNMEDTKPNQFFEWVPTALYNAMLSPAFNYAVAGALWYQGESDIWHADEYVEMLKRMIALWRSKFVYAKKDMPFVVMQLPNWSDGNSESYTFNDQAWAPMRQTELEVAQSVTNTGIAVTIDAGEWNDLHPEKKKTGGTRAALEALRLAYGKNYSQSPVATKVTVTGKTAKVTFETGNESLKTLAGTEIGGFYFVKKDGDKETFILSTGKIISKNEVEVSIPTEAEGSKELRYLWSDSPNPINLYSTLQLPACPFKLPL